MSLQKISIKEIRPSPFNTRLKMDAEAIATLAESQELVGQILPVRVRCEGDGYELISGERRWRAAKVAGLDYLDAIIVEASDENVIMEQWAENEERVDLSDYAKAMKLKQMLPFNDYSQKDVAEKLSVSQTWVSRYLNILSLKGLLSHECLYKLKESQARAILSFPITSFFIGGNSKEIGD